MRQTVPGIASPQSLIAVRLLQPFDPEAETALVLTLRDQASLVLRSSQVNQIVLENLSPRTIPFLVVILPKTALVLQDDWRQRLMGLVQGLIS